MRNCKFIALSGGSGSGKTVLAMLLKEYFGKDATIISQDDYYKDLSHLPEKERGETNFDHPDSIDFGLLLNNITLLKKGLSVLGPEYCFKAHARKSTKKELESKPVVLIEGIYSFFYKEIYDLLDFTVYVEADSDIRLIRRIRRDVVERGRNVESVISQYESNVKPMHMEYISQQKKSAELIVNNNGNVELDDIVSALVNKIGRK